MHDIDRILKLQLEGKNKEAREISDKIDEAGPTKLKDPRGVVTEDVWLRHCFNRGWFLIQDGDYQKGCQLLESGRYLNTYGSGILKTEAQIFNPQKDDIKGKSIIISLEGGYGDEIIHARFATSFKKQGAKNVYLACAPELTSLFSRIEGVDKVILRNEAHLVPHDFWVPGFSSGWIAGHTFDNFPNDTYLSADTQKIDQWKSIIRSEKIKVGIRWAGNPKFEHQQFRRFPEEFITNLANYEELEVYSLQRDDNIIDLPDKIHDLQNSLVTWEDTAAAIMNLDIIITSCTSVAHLSAALGKETWIMVPVLPYHTWAVGSPKSNTSPYYNCVQLFRQQEPHKWNVAFQSMYEKLEKKFNLKHINHDDFDYSPVKINLGCGFKKFDTFINVDISNTVKPDMVVDLNKTPWPWKEGEVDHIIAKDILEHLGNSANDFVDIIKEMYRISKNGALWEVQVPHWRCDIALDDPFHKRLITIAMFNLFDKNYLAEKIKQNSSESLLAFEHDVDIQVCDVSFEFTPPWQEKIKKGISKEELDYALNHLNNVALSTKILIQVHKPGRVNQEEFEKICNNIHG
jgi:hypothetical protein